jgi:hypothetical protein
MLLDRVAIELVERRIETISEPITAEVAGHAIHKFHRPLSGVGCRYFVTAMIIFWLSRISF